MSTLADGLRKELEHVVIDARDTADTGARAALEALAVHHKAPYPHMSSDLRKLRNQLRAKARQLGDRRLLKVAADGTDHQIDHLVAECAYEHWHRMLFARFLAENDLLIEPEEKMAISLAEAEELAKDEGVDKWVFASHCAQGMLPQIFRPDDPLLQVGFATEHRLELEGLLASLSETVFTASDALGWVYQFWQSKKKDEVNRSEVKIGADEIAAVTQLFTEPYMVEFLLHNTLGAWWAGKNLSADAAAAATTEGELRGKVALPDVKWEYLRFVRGNDGTGGPWRPAAGTFDGWPKAAAELKVLDPCCGSGHFLVAALHHLAPIRMAEEGRSAAEAVDAVLRDNLHGLEIDERCCQIAAFALALSAWRYPDAGGYRPLPDLSIACTGIAPEASKADWLELADRAAAIGGMPVERDLLHKEDSLLSMTVANTLEALYDLFEQAPLLGSLIDPRRLPSDLFRVGFDGLAPFLTEVLKVEVNDETRARAVAAAGMAKAAELIGCEYTLVITNVPYRKRGDLSPVLGNYIDSHFHASRENLGTVFAERTLRWLGEGRTTALVTPQTWLFLPRYEALRQKLLAEQTLGVIAGLGAGAFQTPMWDFAVMLVVVSQGACAARDDTYSALDVDSETTPKAKASGLRASTVNQMCHSRQRVNPDHRIDLHTQVSGPLLSEYADFANGIQTGDRPRHVACFWESPCEYSSRRFLQTTVSASVPYDGCELVVRWDPLDDEVPDAPGAVIRGRQAWGKTGITISAMGALPASLYSGERYDENCVTLVPKSQEHLAAIWCYCKSPQYHADVRQICTALKVRRHLVQVPFSLETWRSKAVENDEGLLEPESDDPTQWLFHGRPEESTASLQVGVARLVGYRWPAEFGGRLTLSKRTRAVAERCYELAGFADNDGIVCIPSVRGEESATVRLFALLVGSGMTLGQVRSLAGADLDDWLRNSFFEEHCKLFHHRPFVWHIWDGRKRDGFHALVNYHKLAEGKGKGRKLLESLTYSFLGDWVSRQRDEVKRGEGGAEERLAAALELQDRLKSILEGKPPFDLFVRWKPLAEQSIGWEPDIDDGVRINIRPLLASDLPDGRKGAGVLRHKPNIKWAKDRGKEPQRPKAEYPWFWGWDETTEDFTGGTKFDEHRWNDCHYTNGVKQAARDEAKKGGTA